MWIGDMEIDLKKNLFKWSVHLYANTCCLEIERTKKVNDKEEKQKELDEHKNGKI